MNALSVYLGPKQISIVETKGKKLVTSAFIPQTAISSGELDEKVPVEVKTLEIIALFKDELRKNNIEAKEVILCLSGRDLITRNFEVPQMPREELPSAINFEAKKYIPFKVEELVSDSQAEFDRANRSNLILFMGMKKDTLARYTSIFSQLDMRISAIEYSAFSLLKCLKVAGIKDDGVIAIVGADLRGDDECNFTVLENGFPLFSRDIYLAGRPEDLGRAAETTPTTISEKLKTEIRVFLDYYHRKFPNKNIKKVFFLIDQAFRAELETFFSEIGLSAQFVEAGECGQSASRPFSLSLLKSYSASLSNIKTKVRLDLLAAQERAKALKEKAALPEAKGISAFKPDYRVLALGVFVCIATFAFGFYRTQPLRKELDSIILTRAKVAKINPQASYDELTNIDAEFKKKLINLEKLVKNQLYFTEALDAIPRTIPKGVWLTSLFCNKTENERTELVLDGMVYLADADREFKTVNDFLSELKTNLAFSKYFKEMSITSINSRQVEKVTMTSFLISCKAYPKKE